MKYEKKAFAVGDGLEGYLLLRRFDRRNCASSSKPREKSWCSIPAGTVTPTGPT